MYIVQGFFICWSRHDSLLWYYSDGNIFTMQPDIDDYLKLYKAMKPALTAEVERTAFRSFATLPLYLILMMAFLAAGFYFRAKFAPAAWYIFMGLASLFFLLGCFVFVSYAVVIVRQWRHKINRDNSV